MKNRHAIRFLAFILLFSLLPLGLFSCGTAADDDGKLNIVCTVFPQYDWLRNIIGESDRIALKLIVKNGSDLHSYQATARDIVDISSADMLVYVGGESDAWVEKSMAQAANGDMVKVNLISLLGERALCADEASIAEEHDHEHEHGEGEHAYDEHIWLSLKNADLLCSSLTEKLCELDANNAERYRANAAEYRAKLSSLDSEYEATVTSAPRGTLLFADRFPFLYLMRDYDINYYAAFSGCSADSEASFHTVTQLAKKIDEHSLSCVLTVDEGSTNIASSVIAASQNKDCKVLNLCSMQAIRLSDIEDGTSYLSIMEQNKKVLNEALS